MSEIDRLIDLFVADVCAGKTNETPCTYSSKLARLSRFTTSQYLTIEDLQYTHIEAFRRSLLDQRIVLRGSRPTNGRLSPFTIHTVMRTVKHFLTWTFKHGHTHFDPSPYKIPPPPPPDPKPVTAQNALSLFHTASRHGPDWERARNLAMLYVLRDTAGRISAILGSDIDNLDLVRGKMLVREKGQKPHALYLNPPAISALCLWLEYRPQLQPKDNAIFISIRGTGLKRSGFYSVLLRLKKASCIQGRVNAHAWRHAWVRDALDAGCDLSKVSQTLLHTTIRVTADYYARWADHELKASHELYSPGNALPIITPVDHQTE